MARPLFRIGLDGDEPEFQSQSFASGRAMLERWNTNSRMMAEWLGRFFGEPVWDGGSVGFFARDDQGRQLSDVASEPVTAREVHGELASEFAELKQRLQSAVPSTAAGKALLEHLLQGLLEPTPDHDWVALNCQFHAYRDVNGRRRLVWCCGFAPTRRRGDARPVVCPDDNCRRLVMSHPESSPACPACGGKLGIRRGGRVRGSLRRFATVAALLLVALASVAAAALLLAPNATLVGRVVRQADQQPIADATVSIGGTTLVARTDATGAFRIEKAPRGLRTVHAVADGYRAVEAPIELATFRERSLDLPLAGNVTLNGVTVRQEGQTELPVAGVRIVPPGGTSEPLVSDAEGKFRLEGLSPGPVGFDVAADGYQTQHVDATAATTATDPLRIVLAGDGVLTGRVVYAANPALSVGDADVGVDGVEASKTRVDTNGQFRLTAVPPGELRVTAAATGFAPVTVTTQVGAPPLTLALKGDAKVRGTVIRADTKKPVPEVEIQIPGTPFRATSDAQGEFLIEAVRSGAIRLMAKGNRLSGRASASLTSGQTESVEIVLTGERSIAGRVLDALTMKPLAGAKVKSSAPVDAATTTDDAGRFTFAGIADSSVTLQVETEGYFAVEKTVELESDKQSVDDISLRPVASVSGLVLRALDGKPIAGAVVAIDGIEDKARTDDKGRYILPRVPAGPTALSISAEGYQTQGQKPSLTPGEQRLDDVTLEGDSPVAGVTLDSGDENVAVPEVTLEISADGFEVKLKSKPNGGFKVGNLPAGEVQVKASAAGYLDASITKRVTSRDAWIKVPMVRLLTATGIVVDREPGPNGQKRPVEKAKVVVRAPSGKHEATSDKSGGFSISGLTAGPVQVEVQAPGFADAQLNVNIDPKKPSLEIPLDALVDVQGTVVEMKNNRPSAISAASVTVSSGGFRQEFKTDGQGKFRATMPPGNASFRAAADGFAAATFDKNVNRKNASVELRLVRGVTVTGQVINAIDNSPIQFATVNVPGSNIPGAVTDAKGNFRLTGIPANLRTLDVSARGFESSQVDPIPTDGSALRIVLSPTLPDGEVRIILTWGARPRDLDCHLAGPGFVVNFDNRQRGGAVLDVDGKAGFGPETITLRVAPGSRYRYFASDVANEGTATPTGLATSGGRVQVLYKNEKRQTVRQIFDVPRKPTGPVWHVFDIDAQAQGNVTVNRVDKFLQEPPK